MGLHGVHTCLDLMHDGCKMGEWRTIMKVREEPRKGMEGRMKGAMHEIMVAPKRIMYTKSAVRPRNVPSSSNRQYRTCRIRCEGACQSQACRGSASHTTAHRRFQGITSIELYEQHAGMVEGKLKWSYDEGVCGLTKKYMWKRKSSEKLPKYTKLVTRRQSCPCLMSVGLKYRLKGEIISSAQAAVVSTAAVR